ncbi:MAG: NAD(P) transhydrogenase subunit alpha [Fuerstiella sp.]
MMQLLNLAFQTEATTLENGVAQATELASEAIQQSGGASHLILLLTVFVLAVFVGVEIIAKIPPTLHTPLMSGSNAISGITLVGAILAAGGDNGTWASILGFSAVVFASMNVVGGFVVTNRMLAMFKTRK